MSTKQDGTPWCQQCNCYHHPAAGHITTPQRDVSVLRAHAIAAALQRARPLDYRTNHAACEAWYDSVKHVAVVVCSADGVSLQTFYQLWGAEMTAQEIFDSYMLDAEISLRFFQLVHEALMRTLGGKS
jgi:hypothetical protein